MCVVDYLGKQLDDYVAKLPVPTYVERMGTRSGLIRARLRGSSEHCEATARWFHVGAGIL